MAAESFWILASKVTGELGDQTSGSFSNVKPFKIFGSYSKVSAMERAHVFRAELASATK